MADARFPASWTPYMTWAKHHPETRYDLTGSNLLPCTIDELPGARDAVRLWDRNDDGWPPLVDAIAQRYDIDTTRVATAPGASGANFLALAALVRPGDTVLVEWPGYDPQGGAARFLGARVNTFERGWDDGFALIPERVKAALTPETRAVVVTNLHNPSGVYAAPHALEAVGDLARAVGAKVIVDEVYLDALSGVDQSPAATRGDVSLVRGWRCFRCGGADNCRGGRSDPHRTSFGPRTALGRGYGRGDFSGSGSMGPFTGHRARSTAALRRGSARIDQPPVPPTLGGFRARCTTVQRRHLHSIPIRAWTGERYGMSIRVRLRGASLRRCARFHGARRVR